MRSKNKYIDDYSAETSVTNAITKPAVATVTGMTAKLVENNPGFEISWTKPAAGTYDALTLLISTAEGFTPQNTHSENITTNSQNKITISKSTWNNLTTDHIRITCRSFA